MLQCKCRFFFTFMVFFSTSTGWWFGTWILFFHILGISSSQLSQLTFIFFRGVGQPPTSGVFFPHLCEFPGGNWKFQLRWVWSMPGTKRSRTLATTLTPLPSSRARDISPRWSGKDGAVTESLLCGRIPRGFHQWRYPNSWIVYIMEGIFF